MDNELKKDIKRILLADSLITSSSSISRILDEIEDELEDIFGSGQDKGFRIEDLFKIKTIK
jgi:hypothetical protein